MITVAWLIYLMKERVWGIIQVCIFFNEIRNHHWITLKIFHSDNALEYNTTTFKQFFDTHGIIHKASLSTLHNKMWWQRGSMGICWKSLCSIMTLMYVPKFHLPDALLTAYYLINRMPSSSLHNATSDDIVFPGKPLHSLKPRTFGCTCFVHFLPSRKDELYAMSLKYVSLGYFDTKKGYYYYNTMLRRLFTTMDVVFF